MKYFAIPFLALIFPLACPSQETPDIAEQIQKIYARTTSAKSAKQFGELIDDCEALLSQELSQKHRKYLESLASWSHNRRGAIRLEIFRQFSKVDNHEQADKAFQLAMDDFDRAIDWMLTEKHEWRMVEEAILGVVSNIDKPGSPAGEARQAFQNALHGRTREKLQAFRQHVLEVTLDDLKRVTETYLHPELASTAVITNSATLEQKGNVGLDVISL